MHCRSNINIYRLLIAPLSCLHKIMDEKNNFLPLDQMQFRVGQYSNLQI